MNEHTESNHNKPRYTTTKTELKKEKTTKQITRHRGSRDPLLVGGEGLFGHWTITLHVAQYFFPFFAPTKKFTLPLPPQRKKGDPISTPPIGWMKFLFIKLSLLACNLS